MAKDGERRMLFDTRGRRKNVIRVVYAVLALLMGTSLFFVVGPVNIGEIIGNSASTQAAEVFDEEAERLERRLETEPGKEEQLLAQLTRARINAGNSLVVVEPGELTREVTPEARDEYDQALEAWERYVDAVEEPDPGLAQLIAATFFQLAESGSGVREVTESVATATEAQRISTAARPSVGSYSTLAYYQYYDGDFKAGDESKRRAIDGTATKQEAQAVEARLTELRKQAKEFDQRRQQAVEAEQAGQGEGKNPFGPPGSGLSG